MSFPWATEAAATSTATPARTGKAFVRSNSAAPAGPREEIQATPLGRKHTPEVHAAPHVHRKRCFQQSSATPFGTASGSAAAASPAPNGSFTSVTSTGSQHVSPGKKFFRSASATTGSLLGGRIFGEASEDQGGQTPRGRKAVAPSSSSGGVTEFVGGNSAGDKATSVDAGSAPRGRKAVAAPQKQGTYDISTIFSAKKRAHVDPANQPNIRPAFQRNDEGEAPAYRPKITRMPRTPASALTVGASMPKTNDKNEISKELNTKVYKPEKKVFARGDNAILGTKSVTESNSTNTSTTALASGRKKVPTPKAEEQTKEAPRGLKQVPQPQRQTAVRGLKAVPNAPKSTASTVTVTYEG